MILVMCLVVTVDIFLLLATAKLQGRILHPLRLVSAVVLDGFLNLCSFYSGMLFMQHFLFRFLVLLLTGWIAFGFSYGALLFALLNLSLGSITDNSGQILPILFGAAGLSMTCIVLSRGNRYIPVELNYQDRKTHFTALRDTGNSLRDPITGKPVLVVGADIAGSLMGLTPEELSDPVGNMESLPGLRLIPYKTIGNQGFLLAMNISKAKIGNRSGSVLVAFSPNILGTNYQALTGGTV